MSAAPTAPTGGSARHSVTTGTVAVALSITYTDIFTFVVVCTTILVSTSTITGRFAFSVAFIRAFIFHAGSANIFASTSTITGCFAFSVTFIRIFIVCAGSSSIFAFISTIASSVTALIASTIIFTHISPVSKLTSAIDILARHIAFASIIIPIAFSIPFSVAATGILVFPPASASSLCCRRGELDYQQWNTNIVQLGSLIE